MSDEQIVCTYYNIMLNHRIRDLLFHHYLVKVWVVKSSHFVALLSVHFFALFFSVIMYACSFDLIMA